MTCQTPGEWHSLANSNISMAYSTQVKAIKQMDMSRRAHQECLHDNMAMYQALNNDLESKVKVSHRIIDKLSDRAKSIDGSISTMKKSHQQLLQALRGKETPLTLCTWRLEQREKRPLREHVRDFVEIALEEEKGVLLDTQSKLNSAVKMTLSMISCLDGKRDELKNDLEQKLQALTVDELCLRTTHRSWQEKGHQVSSSSAPPSSRGSRANSSGGSSLPSPLSSPSKSARRHVVNAASAEESNRNEANRQQEARRLNHSAHNREEAAAALLEDNARLIARCDKLALEAAAKTEQGLQDRITEVQLMRRRLESEARETKRKEEHTKCTMAETRSQIASLEEPKLLCSTHSSWRKERASKEQIRDPVETRLEEQKRHLMRTTEELRNHRLLENKVLTELQEKMERLREDLKDKTVAINIDLNCLTHANEMPSSPTGSDPTCRDRYRNLMKRAGMLPAAKPGSRQGARQHAVMLSTR